MKIAYKNQKESRKTDEEKPRKRGKSKIDGPLNRRAGWHDGTICERNWMADERGRIVRLAAS